MTLSTSNTYQTPQATTALGSARTQINGSLRALLQNFYSSAAPDADNINDDGTNTTPPLGTLFVSANTHALYRKVDSGLGIYSNPTGQYSAENFSRRGISYRVEVNATAATANIGRYEIGESYFNLATSRIGYKITNSDFALVANLTDVAASAVADYSLTPIKLSTGTVSNHFQWNTTGNFSFGNTNSTVRTDANVTISGGASLQPTALFIEPASHPSSRHARISLDNWTFRQDISASGTKDFGLYNGATNAVYIGTGGSVGFGNNTNPTTTVGITGSLGLTSTLGVAGAASVGSLSSSGAVSGTTGTFSSTVQGVAGTFSGALTTSLTTESTSTSTGALRSSGGLAVASNAYIGGNVVCSAQGIRFSDGTSQTTAASYKNSIDTYGSPNTWVCPTGITKVKVTAIGGGGGGTDGNSGDGGGPGGYAVSLLTVTAGTSYTITTGTGGNAGSGASGSSGTQTWFGTGPTNKLITAEGGGGQPFSPVGGPTTGTTGNSSGNVRWGSPARVTLTGHPITGGGTTAAGTTSAQTWTNSGTYGAGLGGGSTTNITGGGGGGVGGAVIIEY